MKTSAVEKVQCPFPFQRVARHAVVKMFTKTSLITNIPTRLPTSATSVLSTVVLFIRTTALVSKAQNSSFPRFYQN